MSSPPLPRFATIKSLPQAFEVMEAMQARGVEWGEDYRHAAGAAPKAVLEDGMADTIDRRLRAMAVADCADWRNGSHGRWLMTELGEIELAAPRTRLLLRAAILDGTYNP